MENPDNESELYVGRALIRLKLCCLAVFRRVSAPFCLPF